MEDAFQPSVVTEFSTVVPTLRSCLVAVVCDFTVGAVR